MDERPGQPESPAPPRPPAARLSPLAVTALVCALVPCCPPLNLLGSILGLVSHRRILQAGGRLRGLGLARAAIFSGIALSLLASILWMRFAESYRGEADAVMISTVEQAVEASMEGRSGEVQARWVRATGETPSAAQIDAFGATLRERYGALQRVSIVAQTQSGVFQPQVQAAVMFHFERAPLNGAVDLAFDVDGLQIKPAFRIRSVVVEDPEAGDLRLPPAP